MPTITQFVATNELPLPLRRFTAVFVAGGEFTECHSAVNISLHALTPTGTVLAHSVRSTDGKGAFEWGVQIKRVTDGTTLVAVATDTVTLASVNAPTTVVGP